MDSMKKSNSGSDIEKLTKILSKIQDLYYQKKEQLEDLKIQIKNLREILNILNSIISKRSFASADEIYFHSIHKPEKYFSEKIPKEKLENALIKRKIYSSIDENEQNLLAILEFRNMNEAHIKIINPKALLIKETLDEFITIFLKGALIKIIDKNPNLKVNYNFLKDSDIIKSIEIKNLNNIKEFDLITIKMRELLLKLVSKRK